MLEVRSVSGYRPADKEEVLLAAAGYAVRDAPRERVSSPKRLITALQRFLAPLDREVFAMLSLDSREGVIEFDILTTGTVDSAVVPIREVARKALERNAVSVCLVHNHPSGDCSASLGDELITKRIQEALSLFDIRVLDHCIVGDRRVFSFAESGLL